MRALIVITVLLSGLVVGSAAAREFPDSGRLMFKQGPVCMCDNGLTEQDIRAAETAREQAGRPDVLKRLNHNKSSQKTERKGDEEK